MKTFKVPKHLEEAFKNFLDVAQFNMPGTNDADLAADEREVLRLVRKYLEKDRSTHSEEVESNGC